MGLICQSFGLFLDMCGWFDGVLVSRRAQVHGQKNLDADVASQGYANKTL